jgi:hypothetical protein
MKRRSHCLRMGLLMGCCLFLSRTASAGPYVNVMQPCDCPPTHYSAMHVLTPVMYRWAAWCQGPCRYTFARVLRPEIPSTFHVKKYHCPSVNPLQFSLANYPGLSGSPPASSYQSPQTPQSQQAQPQELPPPREDKMKAPEELKMPKEENEQK